MGDSFHDAATVQMQSAVQNHVHVLVTWQLNNESFHNIGRGQVPAVWIISTVIRILQILLSIPEDSFSAWVYPSRGGPATPAHGTHILGPAPIHHPSHGTVMYLRGM